MGDRCILRADGLFGQYGCCWEVHGAGTSSGAMPTKGYLPSRLRPHNLRRHPPSSSGYDRHEGGWLSCRRAISCGRGPGALVRARTSSGVPRGPRHSHAASRPRQGPRDPAAAASTTPRAAAAAPAAPHPLGETSLAVLTAKLACLTTGPRTRLDQVLHVFRPYARKHTSAYLAVLCGLRMTRRRQGCERGASSEYVRQRSRPRCRRFGPLRRSPQSTMSARRQPGR